MTDQPNSSNELLPCPFCGSEAKLHSYGSGRYSVSCSDFNCTVIPGGKLAAIKAWNTRAPSGNASEVAKEIESDDSELAASIKDMVRTGTGVMKDGKRIDPKDFYDTDRVSISGSDIGGPTEKQVYDWFGESTLKFHIDSEGQYVKDRMNYIAQKAWKAALEAADE